MHLRHAALSLGFAGFCAIFGAVYEHFSFGVYSNYMIYAFAFPLIAGFLQVLAMIVQRVPQMRTLLLLHLTSVTAAVGSIITGIIRIYGTENRLLYGYAAAGVLLACMTAASYFGDLHRSET